MNAGLHAFKDYWFCEETTLPATAATPYYSDCALNLPGIKLGGREWEHGLTSALERNDMDLLRYLLSHKVGDLNKILCCDDRSVLYLATSVDKLYIFFV